MRPAGLADTGALLALLDRDDAWHTPCRDAFAQMRLPLATTTAVLTELFHLVGDPPLAVAAAWKLVRSGAFQIVPITDQDLPALQLLMARYHDRPMDFADATLVLVAERLALTTILTVDNDDFETYRLGKRKRFRILPGRLRH